MGYVTPVLTTGLRRNQGRPVDYSLLVLRESLRSKHRTCLRRAGLSYRSTVHHIFAQAGADLLDGADSLVGYFLPATGAGFKPAAEFCNSPTLAESST